MSSLKSVCSFAKSAPMAFDKVEEDIQSRLRRQIRVELIVGTISVLKILKDLRDSPR